MESRRERSNENLDIIIQTDASTVIHTSCSDPVDTRFTAWSFDLVASVSGSTTMEEQFSASVRVILSIVRNLGSYRLIAVISV